MSLLSKLRRRLLGRKAADADLLRRSGLVDAAYYRAAYPDATTGDLAADCLAHGRTRNPNPLFDTAWYLDRYPDVKAAGVAPVIHYLTTGAREGRDPGPDFDTAFYLGADPGIAAAGLNPLAHYLRHGRAENRARRREPEGTLDAYEAALRSRRSLTDAAALDHVHFPLHPPTADRDAAGRALPPLRLAQRIGAETLADYEFVGRETHRTLLRCLPPGFSFAGARVLDFGCGVGRVLRHFDREAAQGEVWGCDIDGPSIRWAVENLSPPFRLFQLSEIPTIPLESNSFDLVYAISVFAHIHADWHHWLCEVRRILKPGGTAIFTVMAQTPFEEMLGRSYWDFGADFGKYVKNPFADWNHGGPMAFHNPEWLKTYWGSLFDIDFIALDGLLEYQSLCVMRKPAPGPMAPRGAVPVLRRSTAQAFDPDAVGRLYESHDTGKPYLDRYGIEVRHDAEAPGETRIGGWIAFRGDRPASLALLVDGEPVASRTAFEPGTAYRNWADTVQTAFSTLADFGGLGAGEHRLEARIASAGGKVHAMTIPLLVV